jgi:septal ring factor EnvC (AmiA/AmiB activator)
LKDLEQEFATGAQKLRELEAEQARLRDAMLRIDGAMQVLREMIAQPGAAAAELPLGPAAADPPRREPAVLAS